MKKMNKKGFTLIELLAVIVILAIIMVIAVPQILKVIDSSRANAWENNVKLIEKAIETNDSTEDVMAGTSAAGVKIMTATGCTAANIQKAAETDSTASAISSPTGAAGSCSFTVTPGGNFAGGNNIAVTINCTQSGGCSHTGSTHSSN